MNAPVDRRPEPEIIPPGAPVPRRSAEVWTEDRTTIRYVSIKPVGLFGTALLTLGVAAAAGLGLLFLLGTAIIGLFAAGVLTVVGIVAGILRGPPRPLR